MVKIFIFEPFVLRKAASSLVGAKQIEAHSLDFKKLSSLLILFKKV